MTREHDTVDELKGKLAGTIIRAGHATFEVGPSPDDHWAFRLTVHPFRSKKEALDGVMKMKRIMNFLGYTFPEDKKL